MQDAKHRVQQVLTGSGSATDEETKGAFTTVAEAVMSAGNAIGQFSSQMLGGGEVRTQQHSLIEHAASAGTAAVKPQQHIATRDLTDGK